MAFRVTSRYIYEPNQYLMKAESKNVAPDLLNFEVTTWRGHAINLKEGPRPDQIDIEDIAHHLAYQCRYAGACNHFYSIAEHSIYVAKHALKMHRIYYLLHDAHEYLYQDITKPLKNLILSKTPVYENVCTACDVAIMKGLNLSLVAFNNLYGAIKEVDMHVYDLEQQALRGRFARVPLFPEHDPMYGATFNMSPEEAEATFLAMYYDLCQ